jgi:hypothetical protein
MASHPSKKHVLQLRLVHDKNGAVASRRLAYAFLASRVALELNYFWRIFYLVSTLNILLMASVEAAESAAKRRPKPKGRHVPNYSQPHPSINTFEEARRLLHEAEDVWEAERDCFLEEKHRAEDWTWDLECNADRLEEAEAEAEAEAECYSENEIENEPNPPGWLMMARKKEHSLSGRFLRFFDWDEIDPKSKDGIWVREMRALRRQLEEWDRIIDGCIEDAGLEDKIEDPEITHVAVEKEPRCCGVKLKWHWKKERRYCHEYGERWEEIRENLEKEEMQEELEDDKSDYVDDEMVSDRELDDLERDQEVLNWLFKEKDRKWKEKTKMSKKARTMRRDLVLFARGGEEVMETDEAGEK